MRAGGPEWAGAWGNLREEGTKGTGAESLRPCLRTGNSEEAETSH